ncbi:hypothetical protein E5288_WYG019880 [Bos mutus]|uniref:Uncharacterized protein n=1 Tax=Bos mutus TaxID=72004 RepID=A0A6B0RUC9_9CETA|nr:hypothetical protein [Bos mutus]
MINLLFRCSFPQATLPQGDFNFVQHSQRQWNRRGLRKKISPVVVSHCLRRDDVHQFEAHVFPEAHCALCFWDSPVTVVSGVPPQRSQVTTEASTPSVIRVTSLSSFKCLGVGNSLISLVSLLKCYHKTTRMMDELFRRERNSLFPELRGEEMTVGGAAVSFCGEEFPAYSWKSPVEPLNLFFAPDSPRSDLIVKTSVVGLERLCTPRRAENKGELDPEGLL